jgi:mannose-6-phosphate isomerase-like protein (cupin superfamily)
MLHKVNLAEKLSLIQEHWSPRVAGELNGQQVRLVKFVGEFVWHSHAGEDELFLVLEGCFTMQYRDEAGQEQEIGLAAGEFLIVPRGVEHRPVAEREVSVLLFEPAATLNTGTAEGDARTVRAPQVI